MKAKVLVLPGTGIGPEVLTEAVRVLDLLATDYGHDITFELAPLEHTARIVAASKSAQGILLGPAYNAGPDISALRKELGLYAAVSPLRMSPNPDASYSRRRQTGFDVLVVSEHPDAADRSLDPNVRTQRILRTSCRLAKRRWGLVTHVESGVDTRQALAESTAELAREFPDVSIQFESLDVTARALPQSLSRYDVVTGPRACTEWLIHGAVSAGAVDLGAVGYVGDNSLGIYQSNAPTASGLSVAASAMMAATLLLRYSLHLGREAAALESALAVTVLSKKAEERAVPMTPREMGDAICAFLSDALNISQAV